MPHLDGPWSGPICPNHMPESLYRCRSRLRRGKVGEAHQQASVLGLMFLPEAQSHNSQALRLSCSGQFLVVVLQHT